MQTSELLSRFQKVKQNNDSQWSAQCPSHADKIASLSITTDEDGKIALHCHAGCSVDSILVSSGLKISDLFPAKTTSARTKKIKETYPYTDAHGNVIYECVRFSPKGFSQRKSDGNGGWVWKMDGVQRVLFRLPKIIEAAKNGWTVVVVEGEKDVISLEEHGLIATCNVGGAGKWNNSYSQCLEGAKVIIIPDCDAPGRAHAIQIAESLQSLASSIKVLELPDLNEKQDVSDWLANGGTKATLTALAKITPEYTPAEEPPDPPMTEIDLTDTANSKMLVSKNTGAVLYNIDTQKWHVWNGQIWEVDNTGIMIRKAQEVIFELYSKLPNQPSTIQPKVLRHITGSLNRQKLDAMIDLARSVESVSCKNSMFNTNPFLLCVANGVVDLQKGTLLPFEKSYLISIQTNIKYSKDAKCPRWDAWLKQMQPKEEMREYLQRAAGYTLTGDVSEQCLFFCHGVGMNGKTTFVETLCKLLGEYHLKSNAKALMVKKNDSSINNDVAQMAGRRMVSASELNDNQQFDESVVKDITGGDAISARFLHKEFFEFHAGFKLWLYGNHEPRVKGKDLGIWRRIKKIWWKVTISESEKDGFLQEKFGLELDGILAWAVEGCKKWVTDGLHEPEDIKQAVEEYKQSMDSLSDFFEEYCVFHPQAKISKAELWEAYRAYLKKIEEKGYEHQRGFNAEIKQRQGISEVRMGNSGAKGWQGIELQATSLFDSRPPTETDPNSSIFSHEENSKQITENSPVLGRESVLEPDLDEDEIIEE